MGRTQRVAVVRPSRGYSSPGLPPQSCKACTLTYTPPTPHSAHATPSVYCDECRPLHIRPRPTDVPPLSSARVEEAFTQLVHYRMAIEEVRRGLATMRLTRLEALDILNAVIADHG